MMVSIMTVRHSLYYFVISTWWNPEMQLTQMFLTFIAYSIYDHASIVAIVGTQLVAGVQLEQCMSKTQINKILKSRMLIERSKSGILQVFIVQIGFWMRNGIVHCVDGIPVNARVYLDVAGLILHCISTKQCHRGCVLVTVKAGHNVQRQIQS